MNWYVLYVRSRHEFVAEADLLQKGYETFLPRVKRQRTWSDRRVELDFPVFPGYLFIRTGPDPQDYRGALKGRGVVCLISIPGGKPLPVPDSEIDSLKLLIESGAGPDIFCHLKEGTPVRVVRGPMTGAMGVLGKRKDHFIFNVNIDILGRSLGVRISAEDIEPL